MLYLRPMHANLVLKYSVYICPLLIPAGYWTLLL